MSSYTAQPCPESEVRLLYLPQATLPPRPPPPQPLPAPARPTWRTWLARRLLTLALRCWQAALVLQYREAHREVRS